MSNAVPIIAYYFAIAITNREGKKTEESLDSEVLSFTSSILSKFVALVFFLNI